MVVAFEVAHSSTGTQQRYAATSHNAFLHGSAGSVQCVFNAGFFLFHFYFGSSANLDYAHAASQFGYALLQFFAVVVAGSFFDLYAHLLDACLNVIGLASAINDGGVFFANFDGFGLTQVRQGNLVERQADFFGNYLAACKHSNVFEHGFAAVAKARSFNSNHFEHATNGIDYQSSQCFAVYVFCNHQQGAASFGNLLQCGQQLADVADFLVAQQHQRVFQNSRLLFRLVDEVGRQVATVKLHTFNHVEFVLQAFAVFYSDYAFFAHFVHCVGNDLADAGVRVGRNRANLRDFFGCGGGLGSGFELLNQCSYGFVDTALQIHGVHARSYVLHAFAHDGLSQHGSCGGAVASVVRGFGSNFLNHLCAHVHELVFELDFFGYRYAVFGNGRSAERTVEHHIAAFRTQCGFYCVGQNVYTFNHAGACICAKNYFFCCHL